MQSDKNPRVEQSCIFFGLICHQLSSIFGIATRQSPQRQAAFRIGCVRALRFGESGADPTMTSAAKSFRPQDGLLVDLRALTLLRWLGTPSHPAPSTL
jgi:hypothetical protein